MPNARISFPSSTALEHILAFAIELDRFSAHDRLVIDIPKGTFFSPFVMLLMASKITYLKQKCPDLTVVFNGWEHHP
ncbi:MAG: hypothetical protein WBC68_03665, partial [Albidovulum sp.]